MDEISSHVRANPTTDTETLTLKQVAEALNERRVEISYSSLSKLIQVGDIAEQLGINGGRDGRHFPPGAVDDLANFLPQYRAAKGTSSQAPDMLRSCLARARALTVPVRQLAQTGEPVANPIAVAEAQGRAQGWTLGLERSMTANEAAAYLQIGVRTLRKYVKPYIRLGSGPSGDRWRLSDLLKGSGD